LLLWVGCWSATPGAAPSSWGSLNLGGSVEMIPNPNPIAIAELAVEKQAKVLLMPVSARRGLNNLPDDLWTKISIEFYKDPDDAVFKGLEE